MSYADDVKIFMNIMAQSPDGLSDPDLIGKFTKAKATLHGMQSMNQMQAMAPPPMPPQNMPVEGQNNALEPPIQSNPIEGQEAMKLP